MSRKPLRVSGLLLEGKIKADPDLQQITDFGTLGVDDDDQVIQATSGLVRIPITLIDDSPYQPRTIYNPVEIDNLAHSMAAAGLDEPITVRRKDDGRYELIKGHRRTRAARSIGWSEIASTVVVRSDRDAKLSAMLSNEAREDLTDYEHGKMYQEAMISGYAKNQTELAHLFGTSQAQASRRISMLKLPQPYITMLEHNPAMFGVRCAEDVAQLLKEYPGEAEVIEEAVLRINDGAGQNSIKPWVQQIVKAKNKTAKPRDKAVITDQAGRPIFTAKFDGREIAIMIKAPELDAKEIEEMVLAALRQRAEKIIISE